MTSIDDGFAEFHRENPDVLVALEKLAAQWSETHSTIGIGMLFEVLRWHTGLGSRREPWRLNNNYRSRYVRLMVERNPSWRNLFRTRELRA